MTVSRESDGLRVDSDGACWLLAGPGSGRFAWVNEYLAYLADRRYSPRTVRSYAFDLLHFCRWLVTDGTALDAVTTDTLLRFLAGCREEILPGQRGGNVVSLRTGRASGYAPATVNRRLAAISGLFAFRTMRDPAAPNPVPRGAAARRRANARGCSATWPGRVPVRCFVSASPGVCRGAWPARRSGHCWQASAATVTGRWPG
jgi:Phage integrase, N-terminal SAM-like domain